MPFRIGSIQPSSVPMPLLGPASFTWWESTHLTMAITAGGLGMMCCLWKKKDDAGRDAPLSLVEGASAADAGFQDRGKPLMTITGLSTSLKVWSYREYRE